MFCVAKECISISMRSWKCRFFSNTNNTNFLKSMTIRNLTTTTTNDIQINKSNSTIESDSESVVLRLIRKRKKLSELMKLPMNTNDKEYNKVPIVSTMSELKDLENPSQNYSGGENEKSEKGKFDIVEVKDLPSQILTIKSTTPNNHRSISNQVKSMNQSGGKQIVYVYAPTDYSYVKSAPKTLLSEWKLYDNQPNVMITNERLRYVQRVVNNGNRYSGPNYGITSGLLIS